MGNQAPSELPLILRRLDAARKNPHPRRIGNLMGWAVIICCSAMALLLAVTL